jgi:hypothetical protein
MAKYKSGAHGNVNKNKQRRNSSRSQTNDPHSKVSSPIVTDGKKRVRYRCGKSYLYLPLKGGQGLGSDTYFLIPLLQWWYERRWELLKLCLILAPCFMWGILSLFTSSDKTSANQFFTAYKPLSLYLSVFIAIWFMVSSVVLFYLDKQARTTLLANVHEVLHFIRLDTFKLINHFARHTQIFKELQSEQWHKNVELSTQHITQSIDDKDYADRQEQLDREYEKKYCQIDDTLNAVLYEFSYDICQRIENALDKIFKPADKLKLACAIRLRVLRGRNYGRDAANKDSKYYYPTFGRSDRLAQRAYSEINGDGNLVKSIRRKPNAVILLKNVQAQDIIDDRIWDDGDADFLGSVNSILVFPIWYRTINMPVDEYELLGILYFTSKASDWRSPFGGNIGYREFGAALADILGPTFHQIECY